MTAQHRVLVLDVRFKSHNQKTRQVTNPRIKLWQLKGEKLLNFKRIAEKGNWEAQGDVNLIWEYI